MPKTIEEYLSLPYTIVLRRDLQDAIVIARVEELPGCSAHGDSEQEALSNLRENMQDWIADCLEAGEPVPEPVEEVDLPSGKWLQRVPRSLHLKLIRIADREGVSLNQFVTSALAEAVGGKATLAAIAVQQVAAAYVHPSVTQIISCGNGPIGYDINIKSELGSADPFSIETEAYAMQLVNSELGSTRIRRGRGMYAESAKPHLA
jgi:predicted RNase H-like HicB family nuclease